jgi:glyoxylase-like metal-dependent hydrolase (beta-lactamase superfamily II)
LGVLLPLAERVWVVPGGVNIGVLLNDEEQAVLVDTGLNDTSAKRALKVVREELGAEVVAILTTHAHADHFGGNATVVKRTGAKVHAPAFDEAFLRYPLLQSIFLYGGADPLDSLRGRFLLADASPVDVIVQPGPHEVAGVAVEAVPLFGHSPGQLGYVVDGIFFCADVVLPASVLDKYRLPYLFSLTDHLLAMDRARTIDHTAAVPGHGPVLEPDALHALIDQNQGLMQRVLEAVLDLTATPVTAETVLLNLLRQFKAPVADASSFYLLQPTAFAFLSHLQRAGQVEHQIDEGRSLWNRV